jgi:predicted MFS family arabinose efflux permease
LGIYIIIIIFLYLYCKITHPFFIAVANSSDKKDAGLYMGVLNSSSVVAQTVTNLIAGQIVGWRHQNVAYGIAFGGILAFIGSILVWTLPSSKSESNSSKQINSP